jgi:hypothetical protein
MAQLWLETTDAEPSQSSLHAVDDAGLLANKALALPPWSLRIFLVKIRNCDRAAVAAFSAKPADKHAQEHGGIETVCLGSPMLT